MYMICFSFFLSLWSSLSKYSITFVIFKYNITPVIFACQVFFDIIPKNIYKEQITWQWLGSSSNLNKTEIATIHLLFQIKKFLYELPVFFIVSVVPFKWIYFSVVKLVDYDFHIYLCFSLEILSHMLGLGNMRKAQRWWDIIVWYKQIIGL